MRDLKGGRVGKTNNGEYEGASRSLLIIQDSPLARQPTLSLPKPSTAFNSRATALPVARL
ncbi:MAG: hypothetical protein ACI9QQ_003031, partial [Myxococcota bacterium]